MLYELTDFLAVEDGIKIDFPTYLTSNFVIDRNVTESIEFPLMKEVYAPIYRDDNIKIRIQMVWYDVLPLWKLAVSPGRDGYYRAIYIQLNYHSREYYIGKVNASSLRKLLNYKGSGVKFLCKYKKHSQDFAMYYLAQCETADETEALEKKIVNHSLLSDPFCLNLIEGGGKQIRKNYSDVRKRKQSEYMKSHPERYKGMLAALKNFTSEDYRLRGQKIKEVMSDEEHRKASSERIKNWQKNHPEEYARSRENNRISQSRTEVKLKRILSLKKWKEDHPEEFKIWEENRKRSLSSEAVKVKKSIAQKQWISLNPKEAHERKEKARVGLKQKIGKRVEMIDTNSNKVLRTFDCVADAARWLLDNGLTKGQNPSSCIVAICKNKNVPGHGVRKTYLGYKWKYKGVDTNKLNNS